MGQLTRYELISLPFPSPQAMLQFVQLCTLEPVLNVFRHPNIVWRGEGRDILGIHVVREVHITLQVKLRIWKQGFP